MPRTDDRLVDDTHFKIERYISLMGTAVKIKGHDGIPDSVLKVHPSESCAIDPHCVIHDPTMTYRCNIEGWDYEWRSDLQRMDRTCPHGIGHPDPDDLAFKRNRAKTSWLDSTHGCDGCCAEDMEQMKTND